MNPENPACKACPHSRGCDETLQPVTARGVRVTRPNPDLCRHHSCKNGIDAAVNAVHTHMKRHTGIEEPLPFGTWDKPVGTRRVRADGRIESLWEGGWYLTGQQINAENIIRMATMQRKGNRGNRGDNGGGDTVFR